MSQGIILLAKLKPLGAILITSNMINACTIRFPSQGVEKGGSSYRHHYTMLVPKGDELHYFILAYLAKWDLRQQ